MLISAVQQSDLVMHMHTCMYILFLIFFSIVVCHRIANIVLCAVEWDLGYLFYI